MLNYRGKKGVSALHDAFLESNNEELAKALAPYVIEVEKRDNKTEPLSKYTLRFRNENLYWANQKFSGLDLIYFLEYYTLNYNYMKICKNFKKIVSFFFSFSNFIRKLT